MNSFYQPELSKGISELSTEESRHCALVLRHQPGDEIEVLDGLGTKATVLLTSVSKKKCEFDILHSELIPTKSFKIHLIIAPTKNVDRVEWMVEKLSEIGVDKVSFIVTDNSERKKIRIGRLEKKAVSAMKQSKYPFLTEVGEMTTFNECISQVNSEEKWIAQVGDHPYIGKQLTSAQSVTILIGPEGDFSESEMKTAQKAGFKPVSLGHTVLRTETAGLLACHFINQINSF